MVQYILTAFAGILLGIVGMRAWQLREKPSDSTEAPKARPAGSDADRSSSPSVAKLLNPRTILIAAGIAVLASAGVFLLRGPDEESSAAPGSSAAAGDKPVGDVDSMIAGLASRLEKNPGDGEGFRMLGWSYVMTGQPAKALEPYRKAIKLLPDKAVVHSGYGEALVGAAGGTVTQEARTAFEKALTLDASEPRARYFLALWQAQHGEEKEALEKWLVLANSGPADAPWQVDLRKQIQETSRKLGVDVSARLKSEPVAPSGEVGAPPAINPGAMQAAQNLPASDRQAMIDQMVEGLAAKLKANPQDPDGWVRLLRSRMVLQQQDQAGRDLTTARTALSGADFARVSEAARQLGVPGAR